MGRFIIYLAGPGASTAHMRKDCSVLTRRSVVANEPVERQARFVAASVVEVFAINRATNRMGSRAVRLCASCGKEGNDG